MTPMPMRSTTVALQLLVTMQNRGVQYLFGNAGTDWAPLIEALVHAKGQRLRVPATLPIAHETVAIGMAHGYYLATGRPQAVGVHVNVGLANAAMGALNAARAEVPLLLLAGLTPITEGGRLGSRTSPIHWGQDMFDQASLVREAVKWHRDLHAGEQVADLVDRALTIASMEPKGPVYVGLPREVLAEELTDQPRPSIAPAVPRPAHPSPDDIVRVASLLTGATRPVIITSRGDPASWDALDELAERFAVPVVQFWPVRIALRSDHPFNAGGDPDGLLSEADLVIVLDSLVPWLPHRHNVPNDCPIITIAPDPLYRDVPMRSFRSDLSIQASVASSLAALVTALKDAHADNASTVVARREHLKRELQHKRDLPSLDAPVEAGKPLPPAYVSHRITDVLNEPIVVNELGSIPAAMRLQRPDSYHSASLAGGLGWGIPAALGIKLANRDRTVVATVGDGSYLFANPAACHQTAKELGLPLITVVFDNGGWGAVRRSTLEMFPDGEAAAGDNALPMTRFGEAPDRTRIIEAFGGRGATVVTPEELDDALKWAEHVAHDEGREVLLTVQVRART